MLQLQSIAKELTEALYNSVKVDLFLKPYCELFLIILNIMLYELRMILQFLSFERY